MRRSTVLSKLFASLLLTILALSTSIAVAQDATEVEIRNALISANHGFVASAEAEKQVALARAAYDVAATAMSEQAVVTAMANIERLKAMIEALYVAKANGANVAIAITSAETELATANAIIAPKFAAYDTATANLTAAFNTAERVKASYQDALTLIANAIAEPDTAVVTELVALKARSIEMQSQIDENGATTQALIRQLNDVSDDKVNLQLQLKELQAADRMQDDQIAEVEADDVVQHERIDAVEATNVVQDVRIDAGEASDATQDERIDAEAEQLAAIRAFVLHLCPRMRDDHIYSYKHECANVANSAPPPIVVIP